VRFAQVDNAAKTERRLLIVVMPPDAEPAFIDDGLQLVDVSIKEIDLARWCRDPSASIHPRSPFVKACTTGIGPATAKLSATDPHLVNRERPRLAEIQTDIEIGIGTRRAGGMRADKDNREEVGKLAQSIDELRRGGNTWGQLFTMIPVRLAPICTSSDSRICQRGNQA